MKSQMLFYNKISKSIVNDISQFKKESSNILMSILKNSKAYINHPNKNHFQIVYDFINLVNQYYTLHHKVSFYAKLLQIPSKRISEDFKYLGVLTPHAFIKTRIITDVNIQLIHSEKTITLICYDVGFSDPAYFARFYKKNVGITATEYRNMMQKKHDCCLSHISEVSNPFTTSITKQDSA
ncbi:helix-turn-helix domain-containing protein [Aquimarina sp. 2201CG5-10]|uniref:helix-turn-helix domain-containing protein n=1 Tax=Aquimarina callyspongiae TaxID=3098150 RepID=UPI002AB3603A|nr:helix-turn-helix domain-containing protein [Aquimarina sp. 2201CG5-10]MDY8137362.1 helix-turn-helix domain-containing protein [Aquimarina sp. 2201CG5-10]